MKIYYGTDKVSAQEYVGSTKEFAATSRGEFGVGKYFWYEDLPAAIMTAVQYEGNASDWAVLRLTFDNFEQRLTTATGGQIRRVIEFGDHSPVLPNRIRAMVRPPNANKQGKIDLNSIAAHAHSRAFREINAKPSDYQITANDNEIAWRYNLIIGLCAAAYEDSSLIQMKFANDGIKCLNDRDHVERKVVITGKQLSRCWRIVQSWKLAARQAIYDKYFASYFREESDVAAEEVDLDTVLGRGGQKSESKGGKRKGK
jgi:hypothetical protein